MVPVEKHPFWWGSEAEQRFCTPPWMYTRTGTRPVVALCCAAWGTQMLRKRQFWRQEEDRQWDHMLFHPHGFVRIQMHSISSALDWMRSRGSKVDMTFHMALL